MMSNSPSDTTEPDMPEMDSPAHEAAESPAEEMGEHGEICVPLSALAMPDAGEKMVNPEVGDKGTMSVDFTVTRIEGDNAYVTPDMVNGQEVKSESTEAPDELAGLESMAKEQPEMM